MAETLWVARDDGGLFLFREHPGEMEPHDRWPDDWVSWLPVEWFPDLKPGECRKVVLALAGKEGEDAQL